MEQVPSKTSSSSNPNKGKRKIPIEPIKNKTRKQVTFSKRRGGLFKKGSELSSLCGANVAIITFSGAGKFFGFGHPSADAVVQRYVNTTNPPTNPTTNPTKNNTKTTKCISNNVISNVNDGDNNNNNHDYGKYSKQYKDVIGQIEAEKRVKITNNNSSNNINNNGGVNDVISGDNNGGFRWEEDIDGFELGQLEQYKVCLEGLRNEVMCRIDEINRLSINGININDDNNITGVGAGAAAFIQGQGSDGFTTCWGDQSGMMTGRQNNFDMPF